MEVAFRTVPGTADVGEGGDCGAMSEQVSIPIAASGAGAGGVQRGRATVTFTAYQDSLVEGDETLAFELTRASIVGLGSVVYHRPDGTRARDANVLPLGVDGVPPHAPGSAG